MPHVSVISCMCAPWCRDRYIAGRNYSLNCYTLVLGIMPATCLGCTCAGMSRGDCSLILWGAEPLPPCGGMELGHACRVCGSMFEMNMSVGERLHGGWSRHGDPEHRSSPACAAPCPSALRSRAGPRHWVEVALEDAHAGAGGCAQGCVTHLQLVSARVEGTWFQELEPAACSH